MRLAVAGFAVLLAVALATTAGSCARIGDDRFPKLPDADRPDATDFVPDAAGPVDALPAVDAAVDAP